MTDGDRLVDVKIQRWNGSGYDPDWSEDYFDAGGLEYDEDLQAYKVNNVDYCIDMAMDMDSEEGACYAIPDMTVTVDECEMPARPKPYVPQSPAADKSNDPEPER
jgi:hypothetical protein